MNVIRRKVFVSYHHEDQYEVDKFIKAFDAKHDVFIARALGSAMNQDIIDSDDADYVMRRIRELYLSDSTVTIVLIGKCTWARRYVDWEIQASLRHGAKTLPNGLLGIDLTSAGKKPTVPNRLDINLPLKDGTKRYALWYDYPSSTTSLAAWIEDAFMARTDAARVKLINNPRERRMRSSPCPNNR